MKSIFLRLVLVCVLASCASGDKSKTAKEQKNTQSPREALTIEGYGDEVDVVDVVAIKRESENDIEKQLENAIRANKYSEAQSIAAKLLSRDENNIHALHSLGVINFRLKKYGIAKIFWSRVIQKKPDHSSALNNMGVLSLIEKDDSQAISYFKKAIKNDSDNTSALLNLGSLYLKYYNFKAAEATLDLAYSDHKRDSYFLSNYAISLIGMESAGKGLGYLEDAVEMNPKSVDLAMNYASALIFTGNDLTKAEKVLMQVKLLTQDPKDLTRLSRIQSDLKQKIAEKRAAEARSKQ